MKNLLQIFKALSDETRLRILKLLEDRELCICKIMEILEMKQSRISRHMGILKNAGLVTDRRDGKWVHYSLNPKPEDLTKKEIFSLLERCLEEDEMIAQDKEKLNQLLVKEKKEQEKRVRMCVGYERNNKVQKVRRADAKGSSIR